MSTSVQISYLDPNRRTSPFCFTRNACFGQLNRMDGYATDQMEVMEWHPHSAGRNNAGLRDTCTPRKAFAFINSFGMWEGIFRVTSINSVAADLKENPIDAIITGFMSMRDFQERNNNFIFPDGELENPKIEFALWACGIYRNRYGNPFLQHSGPAHGEGGTCHIPAGTDALALYLLVYGTKEDFQGCWAQGIFGENENAEGYVRDNSYDSRRNAVRQRRPRWSRLSDWLTSWLAIRPEHLQGKLGRLTVQRFYNGLAARLDAEPNANVARRAEIINNSFEELRELYA